MANEPDCRHLPRKWSGPGILLLDVSMNEQNNKAPCPPDAYTPVGDYRYKQRDIDHEKPEKTWKKKNSVEPMRQTGTEAAVIIGTEAACLEDSPHARESSCSGGPQGDSSCDIITAA